MSEALSVFADRAGNPSQSTPRPTLINVMVVTNTVLNVHLFSLSTFSTVGFLGLFSCVQK